MKLEDLLEKQHLERIKDEAIKKYMEQNIDTKESDLFAAKCWTQAVILYISKYKLNE